MKGKGLNKDIFSDAIRQSLVKLSPRVQIKNPVMLVVYIGAILTTALYLLSFTGIKDESAGYTLAISLILWFTVLFANFAEAIAEGRGRAQAETLRSARKDVKARKLKSISDQSEYTEVLSGLLKKGDIVLVKAGEQVPMDGEVVEGASRKKTPNEIALQILLVTLTIIFLVVTATLLPFSSFASSQAGAGSAISITNIIALLVCLAPTTIGALLSSIGIAGMSRLNQANVLAMSGRAIEAAGDVDVLLLDKTGTITLGNRQASEFIPLKGATEQELADAAQLSSIADETAEGRSIVILAKERFGIRGRDLSKLGAKFVGFTAKTRMSGIDYQDNVIRKGAADAVKKYVLDKGGDYPTECDEIVKRIANAGGTPLVVAKNSRVLGVIYLKDIVKNGVKERFEDLRKMGIRTIMITGDNPMTAAAIAAEAGVDDFLAEATPEAKLKLIRDYQAKGYLVAMTGDGTNDAPALAQADVAVAMNTGTQAAKEAGNMVDLDSSPTKLIDIVRIGKQLLMTRGALTTFSVANDVAKYFAIIPVLFFAIFPQLTALNIMGLTSVTSAILSAIIYNALIIIALIPLSLKGVRYRELPAGKLLAQNMLIYGLGGIIAPFIAIKFIDILLTTFGLV